MSVVFCGYIEGRMELLIQLHFFFSWKRVYFFRVKHVLIDLSTRVRISEKRNNALIEGYICTIPGIYISTTTAGRQFSCAAP